MKYLYGHLELFYQILAAVYLFVGDTATAFCYQTIATELSGD